MLCIVNKVSKIVFVQKLSGISFKKWNYFLFCNILPRLLFRMGVLENVSQTLPSYLHIFNKCHNTHGWIHLKIFLLFLLNFS